MTNWDYVMPVGDTYQQEVTQTFWFDQRSTFILILQSQLVKWSLQPQLMEVGCKIKSSDKKY